jgi:hypothetical protein
MAQPVQQKVTDEYLLNVRIYLRSTLFTLNKPLPNIGRAYKQYCLLNDDRKQEYLLRVIDTTSEIFKKTGRANVINSEADKLVFVKMLKSIQHPYLLSYEDVDYNVSQGRAIITQEFCTTGSLKDVIYKAKPLNTYKQKYKTGKPLDLKQISLFGKFILYSTYN